MRLTAILLIPHFFLGLSTLALSSTPGDYNKDQTIDSMFMNSPPGAPLLSDIIGLKQCTIMSDYTMNLESIALRLSDPGKQTLILAPLNSAIVALPRKPWVDGPEDTQDPKISPLRNEDRASKNIQHFVMRHIVDQYPLAEGISVANLAGTPISWVYKDGDKYVNDQYKVVLEKKAANGAIWVISGVISADTGNSQHEGL